MTVKELLKAFKYYTTGVEERELFAFVYCEYDGFELFCGKIEELKEEYLLNRTIKSWGMCSLFGRELLQIKVF